MTTEPVSPEFLALQAAVAGRYSLVRELGRGGMGVVFLAREVALDRLVAVKLLPPGLAAQPSLRERFLREARTAGQLSHPHIVVIHSVESAGEMVFFVMEYVAGETLGERLRRSGALPASDALRITQEVAWALSHAHARGVVHRDVKPDNILLEEGTDRAIVMDFGIAHAGISGETPAGVGLGTFHYMSPEQAMGEAVDVRTDVYALGVTAYHALTGRRPFEGYNGAALLAQQAHTEPTSVQGLAAGIQPRFAQAIDRAIHRDPALRWQRVEEMAQELSAARAVAPRLPVPLGKFAHDAVEYSDRMTAVLGGAGSATIAALTIDMVVHHDFLGVTTALFAVVAALGAGMALILFVMQVLAVRQLAQAGYSRAAALRAVHQRDGELEEMSRTPTGRLGGLWDRPVAVNGLGVLATLIGIVGSVNATDLLAIPLMLVALIAPVVTVRRLVQLHGVKGSWWGRFLGTRAGRWFWSSATIGQGDVRQLPTSGEPTAVALGGAVGEIYGSLSEGQRHALAAVPNLIERLESMALDQGKNIEAVMALETLRLDLLRLRAGEIRAESITEGIAELQQVGRKVDAVLELQKEIGD